MKWYIAPNEGKPTQYILYMHAHTHTHALLNTSDEKKIRKRQGRVQMNKSHTTNKNKNGIVSLNGKNGKSQNKVERGSLRNGE